MAGGSVSGPLETEILLSLLKVFQRPSVSSSDSSVFLGFSVLVTGEVRSHPPVMFLVRHSSYCVN